MRTNHSKAPAVLMSAVLSATTVGTLMKGGAQSEAAPPPSDPPAVTTINHDALQPIRDKKLVLQRKSQGEAVRCVQAMLAIKVDGDYGPATEKAVQEFQSRHGLGKDGKVGSATLAALEEKRAVALGDSTTAISASPLEELTLPSAKSTQHSAQYRTVSAGDRGEIVVALKKALNELGYKPKLDVSNDVFDQWTEKAVRAFQADMLKTYPHLKRFYRDSSTGVVTPTTWYWLDVTLEKKQSSLLQTIRTFLRSNFLQQSATVTPATAQSFENALEMTLRFEGGRSDNPLDRGNRGGTVTVCGLTQGAVNAYCKQTGRARIDLQKNALSAQFIHDFYYDQYWRACENLQLPECLAITFFDCSVLFGHQGASCILQHALGVSVDGKIGPQTLEALRAQDPIDLTQRLSVQSQILIDKLGRKRKDNAGFMEGWRRRAYERTMYAGILPEPRAELIAVAGPDASIPFLTAQDFRYAIADLQRELGLTQNGVLNADLYHKIMQGE